MHAIYQDVTRTIHRVARQARHVPFSSQIQARPATSIYNNASTATPDRMSEILDTEDRNYITRYVPELKNLASHAVVSRLALCVVAPPTVIEPAQRMVRANKPSGRPAIPIPHVSSGRPLRVTGSSTGTRLARVRAAICIGVARVDEGSVCWE